MMKFNIYLYSIQAETSNSRFESIFAKIGRLPTLKSLRAISACHWLAGKVSRTHPHSHKVKKGCVHQGRSTFASAANRRRPRIHPKYTKLYCVCTYLQHFPSGCQRQGQRTGVGYQAHPVRVRRQPLRTPNVFLKMRN